MQSFWNSDNARTIRSSIRTLLWSYFGKNQYRLVNSWGNDANRFWITQFIEQHFSTNKKVLMCSCFDYPVGISDSTKQYVYSSPVKTYSIV